MKPPIFAGIALSFKGRKKAPHGVPDFRVGGKICPPCSAETGYGNVKLTRNNKRVRARAAEVFIPIAGGGAGWV